MTDQASTNPDAAAEVLAGLNRGAALDDAGTQLLNALGSDSVRDGSLLQLAALARSTAAGATVGGWKIGWTSRGARTGAGANGDRPFGYVLSDRVLTSGTVLDLDTIPVAKLEPEIAVVLGAPLGGDAVTAEEARAAVSAVAPAFEIVCSRIPEGSSLSVRLGNALSNWGIVVGGHVPVDSVDLADLTMSLVADGQVVAAASAGPDVLDDPFESLARVATYLHGFGGRLEAGQVLITGSVCSPVRAEKGSRYDAIFGDLGTVSVRC